MCCRLLILVLLSFTISSAVRAQEGSPPASDPSTLATMLARVPADLPGLHNPEQAIISYADIAAQLESVGVAVPDGLDDARFKTWAATTSWLPLPTHAAQYLGDWREDYGFDLLQADHTLQVSLPPYDLTLYRGRFDEREIRAALTNLGYKPIEVDGQTILSIRDDYEPDPKASSAYTFAAMNNAAILADGTLVFASARTPIAAVLEVASGERPALADRPDIALILAQAPPDLAGALLVHGVALASGDPAALLQLEPGATPDLAAIATEMDKRAAMPPVVMALLGMTAGGAPQSGGSETSSAVVVLVLPGPEAAVAASRLADERLATGRSTWTEQPFAVTFPDWSVRAVPGLPVVRIDLTLGSETPPNILMQLLVRRDLGFVAW